MKKLYRALIYLAAAVFYFSFWPWMHLGSNETMNFELSIPLVWLVVFDVVGIIIIIRKKLFVTTLKKSLKWLMFPIFAVLSILWSQDKLRSVLILGVLWLICICIMIVVALKEYVRDTEYRQRFVKVFLGTSLVMCAWCFLQCAMDTMGVAKSGTLLCAGCGYEMFGFPHPNGFAAEPQFMGSLLLAPILLSVWLLVKRRGGKNTIDTISLRTGFLWACFFLNVATLFLTLSRGAIYAFIVAMIFFSTMWIVKTRSARVLLFWPIIIVAFLFTLNIQGIMAENSKTDDTYVSGVSKVINQVTLGKIDIGGSQVKKEVAGEIEKENTEETGEEPVENSEVSVKSPVENPVENFVEEGGESPVVAEVEQAHFDGYVEVSTSARLNAWMGALETWTRDPQTVIFGVGMGSGLISMYEYGAIGSSKEIINNQYISILLETGLVGVALLIMTVVMLIRLLLRHRDIAPLMFALMVAYVVGLCFFSGLPNALHVYIWPVMLAVVLVIPSGDKVKKLAKSDIIS